MSAMPASLSISPEARVQTLLPQLFSEEEDVQTYAVLDGASIPALLHQLYSEHSLEFVCLIRGELEPDMAEVAPYLVHLEREAPLTKWLLKKGWGKHWGIFVQVNADLKTVRSHFRKFLRVKDPEGKYLFFRYYDPRVLRVFLPTCNAEELGVLFGPLSLYMCEDDKPDTLMVYSMVGKELKTKAISGAGNNVNHPA